MAEKINILVISQSLLYGSTGGGVVSGNLVRMLDGHNDALNVKAALLGPKECELKPTGKNIEYVDFRSNCNKLLTFIRIITGFTAFLNISTYFKLRKYIKRGGFDIVFFDTSLFGRLVRFVNRHTTAKGLVYFQNIERKFCHDKAKGNPLYLPLYWNAGYNESLVAKYADKILLINKEEESVLLQTYGRGMDFSLPPVFESRKREDTPAPKEKRILFVGSRFYANIEGIRWFIANVMPLVDAELTVVGGHMEEELKGLDLSKVHCCGFVEDLSGVYASHHLVVAPIFSGAGIKVKIADALSYSKRVITTSFAASGYPKDKPEAISVCDTPEQFAAAINSFPAGQLYNDVSLRIFNENYEINTVSAKLCDFIQNITEK